WVFRKQLTPRWRAALWMLVMIRLLLPISLSSGTSIFNLAPSLKTAPIEAIRASAERPGQTPVLSSPRATIPDIQAQPAETGRSQIENVRALAPVVAEAIPAPLAPAPSRSPFRPSWPQVLLSIWLLGVATLSLTVLFFSLKIGRKLRAASRVSDEAILSLFAQCRDEIGIARELQ